MRIRRVKRDRIQALRVPFLAVCILASCQSAPPVPARIDHAPAPVARSNWVVAGTADEVFAFYGLGPGKTWRDIARDVHAYDPRSARWRRVGEIPVDAGRLASAAVTVGSDIYLLGGYTVAADGAEKSMPEVLRYEPAANRYTRVSAMPVPVDDSVVLAWRNRWLVLVSGWHDSANVSDVQLYDVESATWLAGTAWPGQPVFGHAGGIVGDAMLICDGVGATVDGAGRNTFAMSNACWRGDLDPASPGTIAWTAVAPHPGPPLYRSGAAGVAEANGNGGGVWLAGGSTRAYNFNGIGYDGKPANPSSRVFEFDLRCNRWFEHAALPVAAMDFRGMAETDRGLLLFGGLDEGLQVSANVIHVPGPAHGARERPCR